VSVIPSVRDRRIGTSALVALAAGAATFQESSASASTAAAESELAAAVAPYQSSLTSPWRRLDGHLSDLAVVEPAVTVRPTLLVLSYLRGRWAVEQRLAGPRGAVLARGHFSTATHRPLEWMRTFSLGPGKPAFAAYVSGASGWFGFVVGKVTNRFQILPFQGYGTRALPTFELHPRLDATTSFNDCTPNCAAGHWTTRHYRYDPVTRSYLLVGHPTAGGPPRPFPHPDDGARPTPGPSRTRAADVEG
jgi:hypothetical protein